MIDHTHQALLYEAGELPPGEVPAFKRHLEACAECRGLLGEAAEVRAWVRADEDGPSPEETAAALALHGRRSIRWDFARLWLPRAAAAGALAALAIAVLLRNAEPGPDPLVELQRRAAALEFEMTGVRGDLDDLRRLKGGL